jgi:hypothetical protein
MSRDEQLRIIGQHLNWWLDFNAKKLERDGIEYGDDTHVIPPVWPTRGQLQKWM